MKNIPAFIEEQFMTSRDNYLSRIEYELKIIEGFDGNTTNITKSWKTADKELKIDKNIGVQMKKRSLVRGLLNHELISINDSLAKTKSIYKYVQQNYRWNKKYKIYNEVSVKDVIKDKTGNVSGINLLLYNLLIEQGLTVKPILLSTRSNGFVTKIFPVISDFNYLIVQVEINGKTYLLDATNKFLSFGQLPFRCLNQYGRLLDFKKGSSWISIDVKKPSIKQYIVNLNFDEDELINGKVKYKNVGYHALTIKDSYFSNPNNHLKNYKENTPDTEISNYKVKEEDITKNSFEEDFDVNLTPQIIGDDIYINPFLFQFFKSNPFKLQKRTYPIDFGYKDIYLYNFKLMVADNYKIVSIPKEMVYQLPNNKGQITFKTQVKGNEVSLYFKFDFKDSIYNSSYYSYLKEFMNNVINIQKNSMIVLNKKK